MKTGSTAALARVLVPSVRYLTAATPPPDLSRRFVFVIAAVCRMVAAHIATDRNGVPWIVRVWTKRNTIASRIQRLGAQIRAGTVPPLRAGFSLTKPRKPANRQRIAVKNRLRPCRPCTFNLFHVSNE